mmetsp:Transcript_27845/g.77891  ORF Transcript_27845/g.77891 Transcript_27845/m.77891 type:complete len:210 (-) Transcript_27845:721-1350(-)
MGVEAEVQHRRARLEHAEPPVVWQLTRPVQRDNRHAATRPRPGNGEEPIVGGDGRGVPRGAVGLHLREPRFLPVLLTGRVAVVGLADDTGLHLGYVLRRLRLLFLLLLLLLFLLALHHELVGLQRHGAGAGVRTPEPRRGVQRRLGRRCVGEQVVREVDVGLARHDKGDGNHRVPQYAEEAVDLALHDIARALGEEGDALEPLVVGHGL